MLKKGEKERRGWTGGSQTLPRLLNTAVVRDPKLGQGWGGVGGLGRKQPCGSPGLGSGGGTLRGLSAWPCSLGGVSSLSPACPGDKPPESWMTSIMRNIPKQEFCLLQNHCSLCDLAWLM